MARLADMTANQICDLRLKCVEAFILVASKMDMAQDQVYVKGEKLYQFCIEALSKEPVDNPVSTKAPSRKS
jgi:hypothetical protein